MNNGTPHDYSSQDYACDLTGCTFYFDNHMSNTNKIRATYCGKDILLFSIAEGADSVEIIVFSPILKELGEFRLCLQAMMTAGSGLP